MPLPAVNPANEEFDEGIDEIIEDLEPARSKSEGDAEVVSGSPGILKDPNGLRISAARVVRKAKRPSKSSSFCEDGNTPINGINGLNRSAKNLRRSRQGRGLPKKGGAGGKGTWGKLGDEIDLPWVDPNDPNYDSDTVEGEDRKLVKLNTLAPEMSEADVKKTVVPLILEYFENGASEEVLVSLDEMLENLGSRRWMVVSVAIELSMDRKPSHREYTSVLLSQLYLKIVSQRDIGKAFDYLLRTLNDLVLDTPDASTILGNYIARAIADDCIPPKFLKSYKGHVSDAEAKKALCRADTLLSMKHGLVRLDNVWGVGGGIRPVKYLVNRMIMLLQEYLCSCDIAEATRCLAELEVPHFHHELVYEASVMVLESTHVKTEEAMCKLLSSLFRSFVITIDQMRAGFHRLYEDMEEYSLDVPNAYTVLGRWVIRCRQAGIINDEIMRKVPQRGRKRFVSEGDGGLVKDSLAW